MTKKKRGGTIHPHNDNDTAKPPPTKTPGPMEFPSVFKEQPDPMGALTAWRVTLSPLINNLASQAQVLVSNVRHVHQLCPPEHKDDKEALADIDHALNRIVTIVEKLRKLT